MTYDPTPLERFGGLNLRDKAEAVGPNEAIDLRNVEFTRRDAIKQRPGHTQFTAGVLTNPAESLHAHYRAAGTPQLLAGCGTRLEAIPSSGGAPTSLTGLTSGIWDFARFGTPNSERSYAGQGNQTLRRWDGAAWSAIANTPQAGALAVFSTSNRLVAARFNTTTGGPTGGAGTSSPSHIYFSDPGDAETWGTTNFTQLTPGDGEKIQAVIAWGEFVFAFKESKFFVFYGEEQDAGGGPIFKYTTVDMDVGLASPRAVAADETGVYFLDRKGVYRTTGGEPEHLSGLVEPLFYKNASTFSTVLGLGPAITDATMTIWQDRVYLQYGSNSMLVYDTHAGWWSYYQIPVGMDCLTVFRPGDDEELMFGTAGAGNHVDRHNPSLTGDRSAEVESHWRGGFTNYDTLDVKTIRETKVVGRSPGPVEGSSGVRVAVTTDYVTTPPASPPSVNLWSSGFTLVTRLERTAYRGAAFSLFLKSPTTNNRGWEVHQVAHHLREAKVPSALAGSVIS